MLSWLDEVTEVEVKLGDSIDDVKIDGEDEELKTVTRRKFKQNGWDVELYFADDRLIHRIVVEKSSTEPGDVEAFLSLADELHDRLKGHLGRSKKVNLGGGATMWKWRKDINAGVLLQKPVAAKGPDDALNKVEVMAKVQTLDAPA